MTAETKGVDALAHRRCPMNARSSRLRLWLGALIYAGMWASSIGFLIAHYAGRVS